MSLSKIDLGQRLYVIDCGRGYSCRGFDSLDREARAVAAWHAEQSNADRIGVLAFLTSWPEPGTADHYARCMAILDRAQIYCGVWGVRCPVDLVPALVGLEGRRVEATLYGERKRFKVGRSTGWLPCHLALANARSTGGSALSANEVSDVRVVR